MISSPKLADWVSKLVQIPSVTPSQAGPRAGQPGEARIAAQVADWFAAFGGEVYQEQVLPNRPNIYGIWRGESDHWVAIDVHTDTVGVEQMPGNPFDGRVADGRVYGRGATDTKATLGVCLALLEKMHTQRLKPKANLVIAATADEENGAQSAPVFAAWLERKGVPLSQLIIAEPTLCSPAYGHKGSIRFEFVVTGRASHASLPHQGLNAVTAAAELTLALEAEYRRLQTLNPATELGNPTITVTNIKGGSGGNVVPNSCWVAAGYRTVPYQQLAEVKTQINQLATESCPLPVKMKVAGVLDWFFQTPDTPWIRQLADWSGQTATVVPYGTNAWAHNGKPYECVVLGPGSIDQAHSDEEWVEISQLEKLGEIYRHWWGL